MIVRSGAELNKLFNTVEYCGFLGQLDLEEFKLFNLEYPNATITQVLENIRIKCVQIGLLTLHIISGFRME
jgi:hypothetical protein